MVRSEDDLDSGPELEDHAHGSFVAVQEECFNEQPWIRVSSVPFPHRRAVRPLIKGSVMRQREFQEIFMASVGTSLVPGHAVCELRLLYDLLKISTGLRGIFEGGEEVRRGCEHVRPRRVEEEERGWFGQLRKEVAVIAELSYQLGEPENEHGFPHGLVDYSAEGGLGTVLQLLLFGKDTVNFGGMKWFSLHVVVSLVFMAFFVLPVQAATLAQTVSGKILLDVESHGEAWYVNPTNNFRYYMRDGAVAYDMMRSFGLGITDADLAKIPSAATVDEMKNASNACGNSVAKSVKGRILLQVQQHGEAWYVEPSKCTRIYMKDGDAAYTIMRFLSLGITSANLSLIPIGIGSSLPELEPGKQFVTRAIVTDEGNFTIRLAILPRAEFAMVTDTASASDCLQGCSAKPLKEYVIENSAFAGIHGSYDCPPDYVECAAKPYAFDAPVFNSELDKMINDNRIIFYNKPMIVQTTDGGMHYFHRGTDFGESLADYEKNSGKTVAAAIGNWPSLVENGISVVAGEPIDSSFANKGTRGGMGWDDQNFYIVIATNASVPNLAAIFTALHADFAMNLDGGGSAAMYYDGVYKFGPGRLLPNAILFREK